MRIFSNALLLLLLSAQACVPALVPDQRLPDAALMVASPSHALVGTGDISTTDGVVSTTGTVVCAGADDTDAITTAITAAAATGGGGRILLSGAVCKLTGAILKSNVDVTCMPETVLKPVTNTGPMFKPTSVGTFISGWAVRGCRVNMAGNHVSFIDVGADSTTAGNANWAVEDNYIEFSSVDTTIDAAGNHFSYLKLACDSAGLLQPNQRAPCRITGNSIIGAMNRDVTKRCDSASGADVNNVCSDDSDCAGAGVCELSPALSEYNDTGITVTSAHQTSLGSGGAEILIDGNSVQKVEGSGLIFGLNTTSAGVLSAVADVQGIISNNAISTSYSESAIVRTGLGLVNKTLAYSQITGNIFGHEPLVRRTPTSATEVQLVGGNNQVVGNTFKPGTIPNLGHGGNFVGNYTAGTSFHDDGSPGNYIYVCTDRDLPGSSDVMPISALCAHTSIVGTVGTTKVVVTNPQDFMFANNKILGNDIGVKIIRWMSEASPKLPKLESITILGNSFTSGATGNKVCDSTSSPATNVGKSCTVVTSEADCGAVGKCTDALNGKSFIEFARKASRLACASGVGVPPANVGEACTVATSEADCGVADKCTAQTIGDFDQDGFYKDVQISNNVFGGAPHGGGTVGTSDGAFQYCFNGGNDARLDFSAVGITNNIYNCATIGGPLDSVTRFAGTNTKVNQCDNINNSSTGSSAAFLSCNASGSFIRKAAQGITLDAAAVKVPSIPTLTPAAQTFPQFYANPIALYVFPLGYDQLVVNANGGISRYPMGAPLSLTIQTDVTATVSTSSATTLLTSGDGTVISAGLAGQRLQITTTGFQADDIMLLPIGENRRARRARHRPRLRWGSTSLLTGHAACSTFCIASGCALTKDSVLNLTYGSPTAGKWNITSCSPASGQGSGGLGGRREGLWVTPLINNVTAATFALNPAAGVVPFTMTADYTVTSKGVSDPAYLANNDIIRIINISDYDFGWPLTSPSTLDLGTFASTGCKDKAATYLPCSTTSCILKPGNALDLKWNAATSKWVLQACWGP